VGADRLEKGMTNLLKVLREAHLINPADDNPADDAEIFLGCLRLFSGYKHAKPVEAVEALRGRTVTELAQKVWPVARLTLA
jgi:hypothetical protein